MAARALKPAEVSGKWPEDTSNPQVHGHLASTRAHAGWFTRRCVELPSTNPTKSIQNQYNNHTQQPYCIQQPANNHTTTVQQPRLTAYNSAHEPRHDATCDATESPRHETHPPRPPTASPHVPKRPQGRRRRHPPPHCATARRGRGRPEAYPTGRPHPQDPHPQDPKGGAGATPRHTALRRGEGGRRPTQRAATTPQDPRKAAPAPPLATLRYMYGAARAAGGLPEGPPLPSKK